MLSEQLVREGYLHKTDKRTTLNTFVIDKVE
jgi:hypothetical protein